MATSIFDNKAQIPDDSDLIKALGTTKDLWSYLESYIFENHKDIKKEWKFYSKKSGWTFVFKSKDKTLLYLIPCKDYFKVIFVFGEKAINRVCSSDLPQGVIEKIQSSTVYAEGTSFDIEIKSFQDIQYTMQLLQIKTEESH